MKNRYLACVGMFALGLGLAACGPVGNGGNVYYDAPVSNPGDFYENVSPDQIRYAIINDMIAQGFYFSGQSSPLLFERRLSDRTIERVTFYLVPTYNGTRVIIDQNYYNDSRGSYSLSLEYDRVIRERRMQERLNSFRHDYYGHYQSNPHWRRDRDRDDRRDNHNDRDRRDGRDNGNNNHNPDNNWQGRPDRPRNPNQNPRQNYSPNDAILNRPNAGDRNLTPEQRQRFEQFQQQRQQQDQQRRGQEQQNQQQMQQRIQEMQQQRQLRQQQMQQERQQPSSSKAEDNPPSRPAQHPRDEIRSRFQRPPQ